MGIWVGKPEPEKITAQNKAELVGGPYCGEIIPSNHPNEQLHQSGAKLIVLSYFGKAAYRHREGVKWDYVKGSHEREPGRRK